MIFMKRANARADTGTLQAVRADGLQQLGLLAQEADQVARGNVLKIWIRCD